MARILEGTDGFSLEHVFTPKVGDAVCCYETHELGHRVPKTKPGYHCPKKRGCCTAKVTDVENCHWVQILGTPEFWGPLILSIQYIFFVGWRDG